MLFANALQALARAPRDPLRIGKLAAVLLDRGDLAIYNVSHVLPVVRRVRPPQKDVAYRVRLEPLRDVLRILVPPAREGVDRVERRLSDRAMIGMIDPAEEA